MDPLDPLGSRRLNPRRDTHSGLADAPIEFELSLPLDDLRFNPVKHHERLVARTLRDDAGREYESDGFDRGTLREITNDLQRDGHRPGAIIVPYDGTDLFEPSESALYLPGESTPPTDVNFHGWGIFELETPDVLDGKAFVVAEDALTVPEYAPVPLLVRHPDGVAHYEYGRE